MILFSDKKVAWTFGLTELFDINLMLYFLTKLAFGEFDLGIPAHSTKVTASVVDELEAC